MQMHESYACHVVVALGGDTGVDTRRGDTAHQANNKPMTLIVQVPVSVRMSWGCELCVWSGCSRIPPCQTCKPSGKGSDLGRLLSVSSPSTACQSERSRLENLSRYSTFVSLQSSIARVCFGAANGTTGFGQAGSRLNFTFRQLPFPFPLSFQLLIESPFR